MASRHVIILWRSGIPLDWTGEDVVVVASGPSAIAADFELIRNRCRVIAINTSWKLVPWADILYASDGFWWDVNRGLAFKGRRFTSSKKAAERHDMDVLFTTGNNSGAKAISLALELGAKRVLLVGFDMHDRDGAHWHDPHQQNLHNPSKAGMLLWRSEMNMWASTRFLGRNIVNCTPGSALLCFARMTLKEAMNGHHVSEGRADQPGHCVVP